MRKDLYRGIVYSYFLELQQKYVVGEENCPYVRKVIKDFTIYAQ